MKASRNAWWLGALALASLPRAVASEPLAPAQSTQTGLTFRIAVFASPSLGSVAGAEAVLQRLDVEAPSLRASATPDGQIEFRGVSPGTYRAVVRKAGFGDAVAPALDLREGSLGETRAVTLLAGDALAGRVTDPEGRPLSGARVCVAPPAVRPVNAAQITAFVSNPTQAGSVCAASAADGSVALARVPYGHYKISVEAAGHGTIEGEMTEFRHALTPRAWVLTPAGTIAGRFADAEGQGVGGAKVTFRDRVRGTLVETTTDESGVFRSAGLAAGLWRVEVDPLVHRTLLRDSVRVAAAETTDLGTLRARAAGTIGGRLTGTDGLIVAGAEIRAVQGEGMRRVLRTTTTDDQGAFRLDGLANGAHVDLLVRSAPGFSARAFRGIEVPARELPLAVDRSTTVRGVARGADGAVPARAHVTVFPGPNHPGLEANAGLAATGLIDPVSGAFTVENVQAGGEVEVRVYANGAGEAATRLDLTNGSAQSDLELIVRAPEAAVSGRVVDRDGLPVAGASLGRATSDEQGRFTLDGTDVATGKTIVMHPFHAPVTHDFAKGATGETVIVLDGGGVVEGTVTDADGRPVAGVRVSTDSPGATAITGVGGKFRIEHVPAGPVWVRRQALGVAGDNENRMITVESGQSARADFRSGAVAISGTLTRAGGPAEGADLSIQQPPANGKTVHTRFQSVTTDEEGRFTLPGLVPGPARLTLNSGGQSIVLLVEVPEDGAAGLELNLPARIIEGVVLDESGKPMTGACVGSEIREAVPSEIAPRVSAEDASLKAADDAAVWSRVTTGKDGRFRMIVDEPAPRTVAVCTCAQGCVEVPLDDAGEGEPVTLWFDPRQRSVDGEAD